MKRPVAFSVEPIREKAAEGFDSLTYRHIALTTIYGGRSPTHIRNQPVIIGDVSHTRKSILDF